MSNAFTKQPSSFRDPSGFVFEKEGVLYRQVNDVYKEDYDLFTGSGCCAALIQKGLLIPHTEIPANLTGTDNFYKTIQPEPIATISYPYEWSFDMLKDAALLTLQLVKEALPYQLILKDATPYNVQWHKGRLIFIDTLSFEKYNEQAPWVAYRQFCECFLSPLLLMHYTGTALNALQLAYPKGIPLAITKSLLPKRSRFSLHTYLHIHLHAKVSARGSGNSNKTAAFSKQKLLNLLSSLETLIRKLQSPQQPTAWSAYYEEAAQRSDYLVQKKGLITKWVSALTGINTTADLGANDGEFSRLLAPFANHVLATDADPLCINNLYNTIKKSGEQKIQPMVIDLSNPSPAIGVNNEERDSFFSRVKADLAMALALIHHLAIGENMTLDQCAALFSRTSRYLLIEFVPKEDEKVQLMLRQRRDIFTGYHAAGFEEAFGRHYTIKEKEMIPGSVRTLYLLEKK